MCECFDLCSCSYRSRGWRPGPFIMGGGGGMGREAGRIITVLPQTRAERKEMWTRAFAEEVPQLG